MHTSPSRRTRTQPLRTTRHGAALARCTYRENYCALCVSTNCECLGGVRSSWLARRVVLLGSSSAWIQRAPQEVAKHRCANSTCDASPVLCCTDSRVACTVNSRNDVRRMYRSHPHAVAVLIVPMFCAAASQAVPALRASRARACALGLQACARSPTLCVAHEP